MSNEPVDNWEGYLTVEDFGRGPWVDRTTLHPLGVTALLVLGIAALVLPRRWVSLPIVLLACFVPLAQRIVLLSLDFHFLRIMVLFCWLRLLTRGEFRGVRWQLIDTLVVLSVASGAVAYCIQLGTWQALIFKSGVCFDALGLYFFFRSHLRSWCDFDQLALSFLLASVPVAACLLYEKATGYNAFGLMGGVPVRTFVREGHLRAQGAFVHPISAGCFWAAMLPILAARWRRLRWGRAQAVVGVAACCTIIFACSSTTPLASALAGIVGLCLFPLRAQLRRLCHAAVVALIGLHLAMDAPVWHLLARVDLVGGSTGWWRYYLIDLTIEHVDEWWLCGTDTAARWAPNVVCFDVCNHFVLEALRGGLATLLLFVCVILVALSRVGDLWRVWVDDPARALSAWGLGVAVGVHCANFLGVAYTGQIILVWYALLATIAGLPAPEVSRARRRARILTCPTLPSKQHSVRGVP